MKKLIVLLALLTGSVSFAEAPTALQVARDILKESGFSEASHVNFEMQVGADKDADIHVLQFRMPKGVYSCDFTFFKPVNLKEEKYLIQAKMDNCTDADGEAISLKNDYTDKAGRTFFQRSFYVEGNRWKYDFLNDEEKIVARKRGVFSSGDKDSNSADGIHVSNDHIVLIHGQEGAIIFN